MKKLIIFSLFSILPASTIFSDATPVESIVKPVRATKKVYTRAKTYVVDTATDVGASIKDVATEVGDQFAEVGHEIYDNQIKPSASWVSEKTSAAAVALKKKLVSAKDHAANAIKEIKNSEFAEDMKDVGQQFKEVAHDIKTTIKEKCTAIWDKTKATTQEIRKELAN